MIEPRVHLVPESSAQRPFQRAARRRRGRSICAGVKVVGDFVDNYKHGLPSELALLTAVRPADRRAAARSSTRRRSPTCAPAPSPRSAPSISRARTRRSSAISARAARPTGTCGCSTICSTSTRSASIRGGRKAATPSPSSSRADLGKPIVATEDWESCVEGADIVVEASRLPSPQPLLSTEWIKPGALVIPYGTMSAVELSLTDIMPTRSSSTTGASAKGGRSARCARMSTPASCTKQTLHAEMGQIVAGLKPGRERDDETILFWHRGLSLSDIALGHAMLEKAARLGIGQRLRFA